MYYFCEHGHFCPSTHKHVTKYAVEGCCEKVGNANQYLISEHGFIIAASEEITFKLKKPERMAYIEVYEDTLILSLIMIVHM